MFSEDSPMSPRSLKVLRVTEPCPADWNAMIGNDRVRYCGQCNLNVYNLSGMTSREADDLVTSTEGRLCVRYYQRPDGTVLTQDCPVGLAALKRRLKRAGQVVFASILTIFAGAGFARTYLKSHPVEPERPLMGAIPANINTPPPTPNPPVIQGGVRDCPPTHAIQGEVVRPEVMGKIAAPPQKRK
jgi:hypothetical protein